MWHHLRMSRYEVSDFGSGLRRHGSQVKVLLLDASNAYIMLRQPKDHESELPDSERANLCTHTCKLSFTRKLP
jgi:hypothetical protein